MRFSFAVKNKSRLILASRQGVGDSTLLNRSRKVKLTLIKLLHLVQTQLQIRKRQFNLKWIFLSVRNIYSDKLKPCSGYCIVLKVSTWLMSPKHPREMKYSISTFFSLVKYSPINPAVNIHGTTTIILQRKLKINFI